MESIIKEGDVKINSTIVAVDHDDCKIYLFDTDVKTLELDSYGGGTETEEDNSLTVYFTPLDGGGGHPLSHVTFIHPANENWRMFASVGKYSLKVALYRAPLSEF